MGTESCTSSAREGKSTNWGGVAYTGHQLIHRILSQFEKIDYFLQVLQHGLIVTQRTDHAESQVIAKGVINVELARGVGREEGIVES